MSSGLGGAHLTGPILGPRTTLQEIPVYPGTGYKTGHESDNAESDPAFVPTNYLRLMEARLEGRHHTTRRVLQGHEGGRPQKCLGPPAEIRLTVNFGGS